MKTLIQNIRQAVILVIAMTALTGLSQNQVPPPDWGLLLPYPCGVAATFSNLVYVSSPGLPQIILISNQIQVGAITNPVVTGGPNLAQPWGLITDSKGVLYVADRQSKCVFAFSNLVCIKVFGPTLTPDLGSMGDVRDVAIDQTGRLLVVDSVRNTVWIYNPDNSYAGYLNAPGTLTSPVSVAVDASNIAYVSESFTQYEVNPPSGGLPQNDIKMFSAATNNSAPINSWGIEPIFDFPDGCCYGAHGWGFLGPAAVRCAPGGSVQTVSTLGAEQYCCFNDPLPVQLYWSIWNPPGQAVATYTFSVPSDGDAQFFVPDLAIAPDGTEIIAIPSTDDVTAYPPGPGSAPTTPIITTQPQSQVVNAHNTAGFSVSATGTIPLSYQWQFNGTNLAGATASTLTVSNVTPGNLGTYAVVVSSPYGSTNSVSATLNMYPFLVAPFTGAVTFLGQNATLTVGAWGSGPLDYQWYDNGVAINAATNSSLTLPGIQFTNAGLYNVVVSNEFGSVTNTAEQVVVNQATVSLHIFPNVEIQGAIGASYIIQSTTNLANTNSWVTQATLILSQPMQYWDDTNTDVSQPGNPQKYYRILPGQ